MKISGNFRGGEFDEESKDRGLFLIPSQLYWQDFFGENNGMFPNTSDSAVYITAAAGVIALCCAVICKKKIKER